MLEHTIAVTVHSITIPVTTRVTSSRGVLLADQYLYGAQSGGMYLLLDDLPDLEMYRYHLVCFVLEWFVLHRRPELVQSRFGGICIVTKMTVVKF